MHCKNTYRPAINSAAFRSAFFASWVASSLSCIKRNMTSKSSDPFFAVDDTASSSILVVSPSNRWAEVSIAVSRNSPRLPKGVGSVSAPYILEDFSDWVLTDAAASFFPPDAASAWICDRNCWSHAEGFPILPDFLRS